MLVSILTPYYTPDPRTPASRAELSAFLKSLATQPGPCEILIGAAIPARQDDLSAVVRSVMGETYPHRVDVIHRGFDPDRQRPPSRGLGLNDAADHAAGTLFLILHIDNRLPTCALDGVRDAHRRGYRCGAFPKRYAPRPPLLAVQEWWLNHWRLNVGHHTVGTNAVWLDRALWQPLPTGRLLEDFALSDRLRHERLHIARQPVTVSSDRYLGTGLPASMMINFTVVSLHRVLHVDPDRLADELYSRGRLGVGEPGFWNRVAATIVRLIRARLS